MQKQTDITTDKITQFQNLCQQGMDAWAKAGKIIVEMVDDDPNAYEKIIEKVPSMTPEILGNFERIGRGLLYAPLAMDSSPGGERLKLLPLSLQRLHESKPVEVCVRRDDRSYDTIMVLPRNMTKKQAKQVFSRDRIRTLGEQRAILAEEESKCVAPRLSGKDSSPWRVRGGRCEFVAGASLSLGELLAITTQMAR